MAAPAPSERFRDLLRAGITRAGPWLFLTGAGISAESGIPTFRGPEGYWRVGSRNYHPQELATRAAFQRMPMAVWRWYLHRQVICERAAPNAAHRALVAAAHALGERFLLITQNVDGLHLRAGSPAAQTYEIHGNLSRMRCSRGCPGSRAIASLEALARGSTTDAELTAALSCPECGALCRPHVLWFDEYYDEASFRYESSLRAAESAALLVVIGTTASTNLPRQIAECTAKRATPTIVLDDVANSFTDALSALPEGLFLQGPASQRVPELVARLEGTLRECSSNTRQPA
jgi:NAD-dependent deacetylase